MKLQDFTEEMLNTIAENAKERLMRLGINAEVKVEVKNNRRNEAHVELTTSSFNTMPVIYKSITVDGSASLESVDGRDDVYDLVFWLSYRFETFTGGFNGTTLGKLKFRVLDNSYDKLHCLGLEI